MSNYRASSQVSAKDFSDRLAHFKTLMTACEPGLAANLDLAGLTELVEQLASDLKAQGDDFLCLTWLNARTADLATQTLNNCILALALSEKAGMPEAHRENLGLAVLLIGIICGLRPHSKRLANPPSASEDSQATFPAVLVAELAGLSMLPPLTLAWVQSYIQQRNATDALPPRNPQDLPLRILGMLTRYSSLVRNQFADDRFPPLRALQHLHASDDETTDTFLCGKLCEAFRCYPVGCLVELSDSRLALVAEINSQSPQHPKLRVLTDSHKDLLEQELLLDLSDSADAELAIASAVAMDDPIIGLFSLYHQKVCDAGN